jgi:hypothetical protein
MSANFVDKDPIQGNFLVMRVQDMYMFCKSSTKGALTGVIKNKCFWNLRSGLAGDCEVNSLRSAAGLGFPNPVINSVDYVVVSIP